MSYKVLFLAAALSLTYVAQAQGPADTATEELSTDRPDQTEAPRLVPKGHFQIEGGYVVTRFREPEAGEESQTAHTGILFLRYGLGERVEVRAVVEDGVLRDRFIEETTQGLYPLALGAKVAIIKEQKGVVPEVSVLPYLKLPFTSRADSQQAYWSPALILAFENKVLEKWEVEYNVGWKQDAYDTDYEWMASASLHYEVSKKLKLFLEYFGHYIPGEGPLHNADGGLLYEIRDNFQLDFAVGSSLGAEPENRNYFGAAGFSIRLPD